MQLVNRLLHIAGTAVGSIIGITGPGAAENKSLAAHDEQHCQQQQHTDHGQRERASMIPTQDLEARAGEADLTKLSEEELKGKAGSIPSLANTPPKDLVLMLREKRHEVPPQKTGSRKPPVGDFDTINAIRAQLMLCVRKEKGSAFVTRNLASSQTRALAQDTPRPEHFGQFDFSQGGARTMPLGHGQPITFNRNSSRQITASQQQNRWQATHKLAQAPNLTPSGVLKRNGPIMPSVFQRDLQLQPHKKTRPCDECQTACNPADLHRLEAGLDVCRRCHEKMQQTEREALAKIRKPAAAARGGERGLHPIGPRPAPSVFSKPQARRAAQALGRGARPGQHDHKDDPIVIDSDEEEGHQQQQQQQSRHFTCDMKPPIRQSKVLVSRAVNGHVLPGMRYAGMRCVYPESGGKSSVEVVADDLNRLEVEQFLNDTVIDFYIKVIQHELDAEDAGRFYFFNSFFHKKLTEKEGRRGGQQQQQQQQQGAGAAKGGRLSQEEAKAARDHQRVKKWTKDVDIFSRDYVLIPIHDALHWSLVVVCFPGEIGRAYEERLQRQQEQQQRKKREPRRHGEPLRGARGATFSVAAAEAAGEGSSSGGGGSRDLEEGDEEEDEEDKDGAGAVQEGSLGDTQQLEGDPGVEEGLEDTDAMHSAAPGRQGGQEQSDLPTVGVDAVAPQPLQRRACLLHLDSLPGGHRTNGVAKALRSYLQHEWERKMREGELAAQRERGGGGGGTAGSASGSTVPYRWAVSHPDLGPLKLSSGVLPEKRIESLPAQDNFCDCGLFLLSYLEFFTHAAPREGLEARLFSGGNPRSARMSKIMEEAQARATRMSDFPGFLGPDWFCPRNAGLLRDHIRARIHRLMAQQAADPASPAARELMRLAEEHDARPERWGVRYLGPRAWREQLPATMAAKARSQGWRAEAASRRCTQQPAVATAATRQRRGRSGGSLCGDGELSDDGSWGVLAGSDGGHGHEQQQQQQEQQEQGGDDWRPDYDSDRERLHQQQDDDDDRLVNDGDQGQASEQEQEQQQQQQQRQQQQQQARQPGVLSGAKRPRHEQQVNLVSSSGEEDDVHDDDDGGDGDDGHSPGPVKLPSPPHQRRVVQQQQQERNHHQQQQHGVSGGRHVGAGAASCGELSDGGHRSSQDMAMLSAAQRRAPGAAGAQGCTPLGRIVEDQARASRGGTGSHHHHQQQQLSSEGAGQDTEMEEVGAEGGAAPGPEYAAGGAGAQVFPEVYRALKRKFPHSVNALLKAATGPTLELSQKLLDDVMPNLPAMEYVVNRYSPCLLESHGAGPEGSRGADTTLAAAERMQRALLSMVGAAGSPGMQRVPEGGLQTHAQELKGRARQGVRCQHQQQQQHHFHVHQDQQNPCREQQAHEQLVGRLWEVTTSSLAAEEPCSRGECSA